MSSHTAMAEVSGSQGYRIAHFEPEHPEAIPAGRKTAGRIHDIYKDGHGHINYADIDGSEDYDSGDCMHSWGYWVKRGMIS